MAKYFKNVKSFEDLKKQYKSLLKANHPDNGGKTETMQEINVEFDALFKIWKDRHEKTTGETVSETAESTRNEFYTQNGWKGSNHDWNRSLKEIAQIVRAYVKEKYPTYRFSVRTSYASMCQELHVSLTQAPEDIYARNPEDWTQEQRYDVKRRMEWNYIMPELTMWTDEELNNWIKKGLETLTEKGYSWDCYCPKKESVQAMFDDVDAFVESYNFSDCDGMIDYFHVDFYYFDCQASRDLKIVPKAARIKNKDAKPAKANKSTPEPENTAEKAKAAEIEQKTGYTYKVTAGEDTRDGPPLWVVRILETLSKEDYIKVNKAFKEIGGYYSKFKHGFIFRFDPSEKLREVAA